MYSCEYLISSMGVANMNRPGLLNSLTGFTSTLINIYTAQEGSWSATAIITVTVTGTCTVGLFVIYLVYTLRLNIIKM
jgi:hypothetical protein